MRMVLSNISMGISSAFSSDLISTTSFRWANIAVLFCVTSTDYQFYQFRYIKAPRDPNAAQTAPKSSSAFSEEAAFGTYASNGGEKFTYRVKKEGAFGGYKIITEVLCRIVLLLCVSLNNFVRPPIVKLLEKTFWPCGQRKKQIGNFLLFYSVLSCNDRCRHCY